MERQFVEGWNVSEALGFRYCVAAIVVPVIDFGS